MNVPLWKRITEYIVFTYWNWLIVVPTLVPWMWFWVKATEQQMYDWLFMSIFVSLYIGWWTVKVDNWFAPKFYKAMKIFKNEHNIPFHQELRWLEKYELIDMLDDIRDGNR